MRSVRRAWVAAVDVVVEVGGWEHSCCGQAIERYELIDLQCIRYRAPGGHMGLAESHHGGLDVSADERVFGLGHRRRRRSSPGALRRSRRSCSRCAPGPVPPRRGWPRAAAVPRRRARPGRAGCCRRPASGPAEGPRGGPARRGHRRAAGPAAPGGRRPAGSPLALERARREPPCARRRGRPASPAPAAWRPGHRLGSASPPRRGPRGTSPARTCSACSPANTYPRRPMLANR